MYYLHVNKLCSLIQPFVETFSHFKLPMQPIFKEKSNYPDFLRIRASGVLLYSRPSGTKVKNEWSHTPTPPPMRLHVVNGDNFLFTRSVL